MEEDDDYDDSRQRRLGHIRGKTGGGKRGGHRGGGHRVHRGRRGGQNNHFYKNNYDVDEEHYDRSHEQNFARSQINFEDDSNNDFSNYSENNFMKEKDEEEYISKSEIDDKRKYKKKDRNFNEKEYKKDKPFLSFKKIKELASEDINEVIMFFSKRKESVEGIKNTVFQKESTYYMMDIITRISEVNSEPASLLINQIIENTKFFEKYVRKFLEEREFTEMPYLNFLSDVSKFSLKCLDLFSEKINFPFKLSNYLKLLEHVISKSEIDEELKEKIESIISTIKAYEEKEELALITQFEKESFIKDKKNKELASKLKKDKISYKDMNIIIDPKDFSKDINYNIDPQKVQGPYDSYEKYIDTMFFLEYEDCYRSLRKTIYNLQKNGKSLNELEPIEQKSFERRNKDIYCYKNGEIVKIDMNHEGITITIDFIPIHGQKIKFTKRMINGSLVVITDDSFSDYLLTTVAYNPYIEKKILEKNNDNGRLNQLNRFHLPNEPTYRIKLELINISPASFKYIIHNRTKLQLFESRAYFQSYIHVLNRLQKINFNDLPFENEIVNAKFINNSGIENRNQEYFYDKKSIIPSIDHFPPELKDNLDESQLNAVKVGLTNKIALIQGPPGTGKTHVGTIVTDIIQQNLDIKSKILVVCYTNHALDQFIENILDKTEDIVRIGGRCKNERVKAKVLNNTDKFRDQYYKNLKQQLNNIGKKMKGVRRLIDKNERLNPNEIKYSFPQIYDKIIGDFFKKLGIDFNYMISKFKLGKDEYRLNKEKILFNKIFLFWSFIGHKNYKIAGLFNDILTRIENEKQNEFENIFRNAVQKFKGYDVDNENLLNKLENSEKLNRTYFYDNNEINDDYENYYDEDEEEESSELNSEQEEKYENYRQYDGEEFDKIFNDNEEKDFELDFSINYDGEITENKNNLELNEKKINYLLSDNVNFFKIGPKIIKLILNYMKNKKLEEQLFKEQDLEDYQFLLKKKNEYGKMLDGQSIKDAKIVAMTTTGCAKYSTILEQFNFEVIVIEEAAEVLEPHILALLTKNTKQLIMIGDHKQLRPKPYSYELAKKYHFDISMFERLINNGINFASLKYQRRMKPLFANFVRIIYGDEEYIDYKKNYTEEDKIKGMTSDMYIIRHKKFESDNPGIKSKQNEYEAEYLVKLYGYLIKQGYSSNEITILTFYVGQVLLIRNLIKNKYPGAKVTSVDNYQGEENNIILLSLVRSNKDNDIGFLRAFNRVCVAFSRAKLGFYVIGNIDSIIKGIEKIQKEQKFSNDEFEGKLFGVWEQINKKAKELNIIGKTLELKCQRHGNITEISSPDDFANCPEGGCQQKCGKRMKCGHACEKSCHYYDCNEKKCTKTCNKINPNCIEKKHRCKKKCYEDCGQCHEIVTKILPCNHETECYCCDDITKIKCQQACNKILPCGHKCSLKCFENCSSQNCKELVSVKLSCGHMAEKKCYEPIYKITCKEKCTKILPCGHQCIGTCGKCLQGTLHMKCNNTCGRNLVCGHACKEKCSAECICFAPCPNKCPHGYCEDKCCEICVDCIEPCTIKCKHRKCTNLCGEKCNVEPCNERCPFKMRCEHRCMGLCGERCPMVCKICHPDDECFNIFFGHEDDDDALFYKTECGHVIEYRDMDTYIKGQRNIAIPTCPKCKSLLIWEPRYQNNIREMFSDVQKVKRMYLESNAGYEDEFYKKGKLIVDRILQQYNNNKIAIFEGFNKSVKKKESSCGNKNLINSINDLNIIEYENKDLNLIMPIIYNLCKNKFDNKKVKSRLNSSFNLLTLAEKFMGIEYMKHIIIDNKKNNAELPNDEQKFMQNFYVIQEYFTDFSDSFNYYFFKDLKLKIDNMLYYSIIKLKPKIGYATDITIDDIISKNFTIPNLDVKTLYQIHLIGEATFLFKSLGSIWYKCLKGHYYCAEECVNNNPNNNRETECPICKKEGKSNILNSQVDINQQLRNEINNNIGNNPLFNQDQNVLRQMGVENIINNLGHQLDPDIIELMMEHPEWNEYN